jgi:predicted acylesterase/phospholipase RssA
MEQPIARRTDATSQSRKSDRASLPGQIVLVLQGGGALGSYQAGVYQALHEAGTEPDWIVGTSIGAINASLITGNAPQDRLARLIEFWSRVQRASQNVARIAIGRSSNMLVSLRVVGRKERGAVCLRSNAIMSAARWRPVVGAL